jgi:transmembrane sensor
MTQDAQALLRRQAQAWAVKLKTGKPTPADVAAFKRWRDESPAHGQAWSLAAHDWSAVDEGTRDFLATHPVAQPPSARARLARRAFMGSAIAGGGALAVAGLAHPLLGLWPSWAELGADYRTATGEQRAVQVGDAIQLALNTQTSIAVSERAGPAHIRLIAGEAAVTARQTPCEVEAGAGRLLMEEAEVEVRQLGADRVSVVCRQGAARLNHPARTVTVAAGQQLVYDAAQVSTPGQARVAQSAWRDGMVVFDNMPLAEVVAEINRYRPGRVVLMGSAAGNRRFSARFRISALDEAIALLQAAHGVQVRRMGELVLLS